MKTVFPRLAHLNRGGTAIPILRDVTRSDSAKVSAQAVREIYQPTCHDGQPTRNDKSPTCYSCLYH